VLGEIGVHEAWLPTKHLDRIQFRVAKPRLQQFSSSVVDGGWARQKNPAWPCPIAAAVNPISGWVRGPIVEGDWPHVHPSVEFEPAATVAVRLAVALRQPAFASQAAIAELKETNARHPNLLVRQLVRALTTAFRSRQEFNDG
jgi:hypothetical protein